MPIIEYLGFAITALDTGHYDEQCMLTVGMSKHGKMLTVVWVERGDIARIITAFEPSVTQKRRYEHAKWTGLL